MKSKGLVDGPERTFVLILDSAEEAFAAISNLPISRASAASVTAIGAFERTKVGWFDFDAKKYKPIAVGEQCEVLSLLGDIAEGDDGNASLHLHAVLGLSDVARCPTECAMRGKADVAGIRMLTTSAIA